MIKSTSIRLKIQILMALHAVRSRNLAAQGSVNISTIIWIVIGVLVAGGVSLWLTAGGGIAAITALLKAITTFFNQNASTL